MLRTASHGLAFKVMPGLLSGLMLYEISCDTRQGARKMDDSEKKETVFTKKEEGKDTSKTKLKEITPIKPGNSKKILPPKKLPPSEMSKEELDNLLKRAGERIRGKDLKLMHVPQPTPAWVDTTIDNNIKKETSPKKLVR